MSDKLTVCDKCLTVSCWLGKNMCKDAEYAGTTTMTREELAALGHEHPSYWEKEE